MSDKKINVEGNEKKGIGLSTKIFIALIVGALVGVAIHYVMPDVTIGDGTSLKNDIIIEGVFYVVGQGFIRLMQMLVVPLVFCSLVCGAMAIGDTKTLGKVGVKTIVFYIATTALAVTIALSVAYLINPGIGLDMDSIQKGTVSNTDSGTSIVDTLLNIIPKNPIGAMASGDMLPIIVFALFVGIMLAKLGSKASTVATFFSQFNDVMMEMTMAIMKIAPIGVFCLIARTFANLGFSAFQPMLKYMGSVILALCLQCFVIYQILLFIFTRLNPLKFIKKFLPVMGFAFSTATSNATIPMSIDTLDKKMGVSKRISSFTIPLGATINMDGTSIMQGVAVVFIAQAYGIDLTLGNLATVVLTATIASIGTAGVPSVGLVTLAMVLNSVGLPTEGIALIMGIDRILDMLRTAVNITGDAVCTTIVAKQEGALDKEVFNRG
ncbi:MAG: dicarboxylate/amino acid:cation symporter [Lachnospiraceae bacterium]|nr:dicarboxylate/amino acid:cation symporter [Lachnospiraceae bacterium]